MELPHARLVPKMGSLSGPDEDGLYTIEIPLEPLASDEGEGVEETAIRLEFIALPVAEPQDVSGQVFGFPINPEDGYIDGSMYAGGAHNPVDVTEIAFGEVEERVVEATLTMRLLFEFEGSGFADRDAVLRAKLNLAR